MAKKKVRSKAKKTVKKKAVKKVSAARSRASKPVAAKPSETISKPLTHNEIKQMRARHHPIELLMKFIILFSFIGLLIAGYLIYMHYRPEASTICTFEGKLNCDVVNKSVYSKFLGIPNSIIGAAGYLFFIVWGIIILKGYDLSKVHSRLRARHLNFLVILFAIIGFGFSMYLLYIEKYILHAYCIFCLASLGVITIILLLAIFSWRHCVRCRNIMHRIHYKARGKMCRYC